jgi:phosphoglycolate phosphatase-like HAD superfamily hydrolase
VSDQHPLAIDLDALGDTRRLWDDWVASAGPVLGIGGESLPADRAAAAERLDSDGAGNWRVLLERFCEDRAPVYLRRDAVVSAALRSLSGEGRRLGVFTDAPEPLARVALSQLGAERRVEAVETGRSALARLIERLGGEALVVRTRDELHAAVDGS